MVRSYGDKEFRKLQYEVLVHENCNGAPIHCSVPCGAVVGGHDIDGMAIYVGRTHHESDQLPCKIIPGKNGVSFVTENQNFKTFNFLKILVAYCSYDGKQFEKKYFDFLVRDRVFWVCSSNGSVPPNAGKS